MLDPIDGTKSFISGMPLFGTLIALTHRGRPVLGVIDQPMLRERWVGAAGRADHASTARRSARGPARASPRPRCMRPRPTCSQGEDAAAFARLRGRVKLARYGADCYAYALLATGFIDLVVEGDLKPYDFCALVPVIEGAGGVMSRLGTGARSTSAPTAASSPCGDPALLGRCARRSWVERGRRGIVLPRGRFL